MTHDGQPSHSRRGKKLFQWTHTNATTERIRVRFTPISTRDRGEQLVLTTALPKKNPDKVIIIPESSESESTQAAYKETATQREGINKAN